MSLDSGGLGVRSVISSFRTINAERREDALLAGVLGLAGLAEVALGGVQGHTLVASLSVLVMTAGLMLRRVHPVICVTLVLLAVAVQSILGVPNNAQLTMMLFILVAAYSAGAHLGRRGAAIGLALGAVLVSVAVAAAGSDGSDFGFGLLLVTSPWIAGVLVRARSLAAAQAVANAQSRARQAADEERQRIARELHDIVSHSLSAMVVQAAAAGELIDRSPEAARKAMHEIQATGAGAMTEMRHMLGLMRGGDGSGRRPQPALEDVKDLVAAEQAAGQSVKLTIEGTPRELPRGMALSVFRIVQESLTNVRKHATRGDCEVTITYALAALDVEIVDNGLGSAHGPTDPGFGIIGMCERAQLYGGALEAGPRSPDGGWVVRGRFPLEYHVLKS
jgi:signal transduction histidine kinase